MVDESRESLRWYDPDQVMRVERGTLLSACDAGSPFGCGVSIGPGCGNVKAKNTRWSSRVAGFDMAFGLLNHRRPYRDHQ